MNKSAAPLKKSSAPAQKGASEALRSSIEGEVSRRSFYIDLALIIVLATVLYVSLGWTWEKFSRAEVFFAECAREMLRDKDYVTPLYHGQAFFDKPILVYWFILAMFKTFGVTHLAARVPSIIAAAITTFLTAVVSAKLFSRRAGLLAAMALSSSFMFIGFAYLCMSDMTLVMFDLISMTLLYVGTVFAARRNLMWWLASVSIGFAFLTKGPVGVVLPAVSFLVYLALTRQLKTIKFQHLAAGALTILVISLPWWIAAYRANGAGALVYFFIRENLIRYAGSTYDTHKPIWFMVVSLMTGFAPWSVFLPIILFQTIKDLTRSGDNWLKHAFSRIPHHELYLWLWIGVVTCFFSLSRGKCDYYVLPVYPAAACLTGIYLDKWITANKLPPRLGLYLLAAGYLVTAVGAAFILPNMSNELNCQLWFLMPLTLVLAAAAILFLIKKRKLFPAFVAAFAGLCLSATAFSSQIIPNLVHLVPTGILAAELNKIPPGDKLGVHESLLSWIDEITFQTNREPVKLTTEQLDGFLSSPEPALLIVSEDKLKGLSETTRARLNIICKRIGITHTLTPGYAIKCKGHLTDPIPVVLVSNH